MAPNILYIMADQMAASALSMYGGPAITPHLKKIAAGGTVFDAAYCPSPICAPSRFAMMTGQLPHRVGAYDNSSDFPASIPTFAHYLRNAGYRTCLSGKMHFVGPDQLHGFEERLTTDIYPADFTWAADWDRGGEAYSPSNMSPAGVIESGLCERSLQLDFDQDVTHAARRKLFDYARFDRDKPFFMCVSYTHPHNPFVITKDYWDRYEGVDLPGPKVPYIPYEDRDAWSQRYFRTIRQDEYDVSDAEIAIARRAYYGMISFIDDQIGILLQTLKDANFEEDTIVVFASDHGEMLGERGMWFKFNPYEGSIRVPIVIKMPGMDQAAREARAVSLLDLLPTFIDMASEGELPVMIEPVDGKSLLQMLKGTDHVRTDEVVVEYFAESVNAPAIILRRDGLKYVFCGDDPGLLFDLKADPLELVNLAESESHAQVAAAMRREILQRWDIAAIEKDVRRSQARRRVVQQAIDSGIKPAWDYTPPYDGTREYVRPNPSLPGTTDIKRKARYPYVQAAKPDHPRKV
ncbi:MAG: choline-sulfatase [Pseudorhodobacter sp.]|jgi:choline-sulfatase